MPKLYDKVSTDFSDASAKSFSVCWNVLSKSDMEEMKAKLESWVGASMTDNSIEGQECYIYSDENVMITIYYYDEPMVGMEQCTVSINSFSY